MAINFFDHADIYAGGAAECLFGEAVEPSLREHMILQTKCGIRYDFSKQHILAAVDASLKQLKTDYIDILLLHRPDALMELEEVAEAFDTLKRQGKIRCFGVSNQNAGQIELLNRLLQELAEKYHVSKNAIAVAWILRHPTRIQTIVGSTNQQRIADISRASDITLTREEWYALYIAAGKQLP